MSLTTGRTGPCAWTVVQGNLDDALVDRFVENLRHVSNNITPNEVVLDITRGVSMPTSVQRRRIAEAVQSSPRLELVAGHALVINSVVGRGLLTAINWVVRPPFEESIFATPAEALAWLESRNPEVSAARVMASIHAAVPGFDHLTW